MAVKQKLRNVLLLMDPLTKLDPRWDNSLALVREFIKRGCVCWSADSSSLSLQNTQVWVRARPFKEGSQQKLRQGPEQKRLLEAFDLAIIRKEPPFDLNYYAMTLLLEHATIPVVNRPQGIRTANEKLWGLQFSDLMPETLVSSSVDEILLFGKKFKQGFVIKPLYEKGGHGVFKVKEMTRAAKRKIAAACSQGTEPVICQKFLRSANGIDKRIVLLDGKILCAFEKHPSKKDFRANLGLGATAHPTRLNKKELQLARKLARPLQKAGLFLAGLDVMSGKLLEVNVTSPAGMTDAETLYPRKKFIAAWADWLEHHVRQFYPRPR